MKKWGRIFTFHNLQLDESAAPRYPAIHGSAFARAVPQPEAGGMDYMAVKRFGLRLGREATLRKLTDRLLREKN